MEDGYSIKIYNIPETEKDLKGYTKSIPLESLKVIIEQMDKSLFKIDIDNGNGIGFLAIINNKGDWNSIPLKVLMTNNHVLKEIDIGKEIHIILNKQKINIYIE